MFYLSLKQASQWGTVAVLLILTGCASVPERQPLPPEYTLKAEIPGIPEVRFWGDEWPTFAQERFDAIAREHKKGRRLFVGTVNLDAGRSVISNIGAIAASDHPQKITLIHDLLRASAAIPIAFPPVIISVEADGEQYDELHVDGGTGSQVFVYPAAIDWKAITRNLKVQGEPKVYIIRNSFLYPDYQGITRNVLPIASRTIDSLIRTQGIGDLYQIYALCRRDGNDFNQAYIPSDFTDDPTEGFDPVYMKKLLDRGYQMALDGYPWEKTPPGFILNP